MRPTVDEIRDRLTTAGYGDLAIELAGRARDAIGLTPIPTDDAAIAIGASKFGGDPDLPAGVPWPSGPMGFLAQINLAEASRVDATGLLPKDGLVSFFYDHYKGGWGFSPADRESFVVLYTPAGEPLVRRKTPEGTMGEYSDEGTCTPCALEFARISSVPSLAAVENENASLLATDEEHRDLTSSIWGQQGEDGTVLNQMLGHPYPVQNPDIDVEAAAVTRGVYLGGDRPIDSAKMAEAEADAENWVLLLQLDTDDRPGWMWGDMGLLYFYIRKDALAARDFSKAWCILQCG